MTDDKFTLVKAKLRQDAQFLTKILSLGEDGKMKVHFHEATDYQQLLKMVKNSEYLDNESINSSSEESIDEKKSNASHKLQFLKKADDLLNRSHDQSVLPRAEKLIVTEYFADE